MNDRSILDMVLERWDVADRARDITESAIENEKYYHNYIDETTHPYLSNIALPWPYIIVESYLGKCVQMLASQMPYVRVVEEDDDSRPKAKKVERDVNMTLYLQKWPIFSYNTYKQAFKYGTAFINEIPWGTLDGREMPLFQLMNFFNVWVNPSILNLMDDDAFLIYRSFAPLKNLRKLKGNENYKNLDKIKVYGGDMLTEDEREIRSFKQLSELPFDKHSEMVEILTYWSNDELIIVTNEDNVIRSEDNFLGFIPIKAIRPIPVENEFYGMSILEQGKGLFSEANENRNQFNDAMNLMLNPQYVISRNSEVKRSSITSKPGGIIWTEDVNGVQPMKQDWNILMASLKRHALVENDIQNYSNAFPTLRGQPSPGVDTATEYMGLRGAGELRSDTYNLLLSMMSIEDMARDIVIFKRMFMTQPDSFHYWPEGKSSRISPDDYYGNFSFKAFAGYKMTQEIERKQLIEALTMVTTNPMFQPLIAPKANEWLERLLDRFPNIRSPEQLYVSDTEMMMQQLQQMLMGGMEGQGERLALGEKAMRTPEQTPNLPQATMLSNEIVPRG